METFGTWILKQIDNRGWTQAELARRAHIGQATLSRIISDTRGVGPDVCVSLARAFKVPPEQVFRLAGLLPPLPEPVAEEREALTILRTLPTTARQLILTQLRALAGTDPPPASYGQPPVAALAEPAPNYTTDPDPLTTELLDTFHQLPEEWQQEAVREIEKLQRLSTYTIRIIGDENETEPSAP